jgi:putative ABC transport system permease protein
MFVVFGLAALFLAAVGLYGVMSFSVTARTHEMGVRLALGAPGGRLVWLVLRKSVGQLAIGLVIGLALAALAAGPLQIILYQVEARDPVVFGGVAATLALVGFAAAFIPARRAARVHPAEALNAE